MMSTTETDTIGSNSPIGLYWAALERYLLYVMVFSLPLQGLAVFPEVDITVTKAGGAMLIAAVALRHLATRRWPGIPRQLAFAVALFLVACLLSIPRSVDWQTSVNACATFAAYAITLFAVLSVASDRRVQGNIVCLYVGGAVVSALGALGALFGLVTPTVDHLVPAINVRRIAFGVFDANEQSLLFLFALAVVLFDPVFSDRHRKLVAGLAAACVLAGLLLTMSRTGWALSFVLLCWRVVTLTRRMRFISLALVIVTLVSVSLAVTKPAVLSDVQRRIVEAFLIGDRSSGSRAMHMATASDFARQGGPFGYGLNTATELSKDFRDPLGRAIGQAVHNVPLNIWIETGWIGLLSFFWLWSSVIAFFFVGLRRVQCPRSRGRLTGYTAGLLVYGVVSLVMPFMYRSAFPILLGCACGFIVSSITTEEKPSH